MEAKPCISEVWIPQPFLVGAKKTRLGLGIGVGALQSVGADVITKIEVFHCTSYEIINKDYFTCLMCVGLAYVYL